MWWLYIVVVYTNKYKNAEKQLNHQRDSEGKKRDRQMLHTHALHKIGTCLMIQLIKRQKNLIYLIFFPNATINTNHIIRRIRELCYDFTINE